EWTLVTIVVDVTGSVQSFKDKLLDCLKTIIKACHKNQRAENLMVRVLTFNEDVHEIHGFMSLPDIDVNDYKAFNPAGMTNLHEAVYNSIGATLEYGKHLVDQDLDVNGCVYIITDGCHNHGSMTAFQIAKLMEDTNKSEEYFSLLSVLVGLNEPGNLDGDVVKALEDFTKEAKLTEYVDLGDATSQRLAKLANWVSQSVSSQSQAIQTGSPVASQPLSF
ncbi:hypothetical protein LCGC14_2776600, partial [marine sediment metagenome]